MDDSGSQLAFHISGLLKVGQVRGSSAAAAFPSRPLQTVKEPGEREPEEREREGGRGGESGQSYGAFGPRQ